MAATATKRNEHATAIASGEDLFAMPVRQERSLRSLERVLHAAETVLRRDGLDGFSIAAIAAESGISVGGIYARVKGKQELLQLLKTRMVGRVSAANERAIDCGQASIHALLDDFVDSLIDGFSHDERLHRALFAAGLGDVTLHVLGEQQRRANLAVLGKRLVEVDARLAAHGPAIDFGTDMIASLVVARLTRPGSDQLIDWAPVRTHLKVAAIAYFESLLAPSRPGR